MHSFVMQDWITIRGANATAINQGESSWLDLGPYQDVSFYVDVREYSGSSTPTLQFQTAPLKEDVLFQNMLGTAISVNSITNPYRVAITTTACPVARYVRWQLVGPASTWDVTFRVVLAATALGL
jgi:hypothetical protein